MATKLNKNIMIRAVSVRRFSASTNYIPVSGVPNASVETSKSKNNLVVASSENCSPLTRVSVLFKAGSRYEDYDSLGAAHFLRIAAGLTTKNATQFSIMRHIQQLGTSLTCTTDREVIAYTLEGTRDSVQEVLPFLAEVSTQQVFRPWELSDNIHRLKLELKIRPYELRALDMLHRAAYRETGLGNSLFIGKSKIGKISSETLQHYVCQNFISEKAAVAGVGIKHSDLVKFAECLSVSSGSGNTQKSKYRGGEARLEKGGDIAYIAIAKEGGVLAPQEALTFGVLQHIFGNGSAVKYGVENKGLFAKAVTQGVPAACIQTINANYSDSGLFGALICVCGDDAEAVVKKVAEVLNCHEITDSDIARGKAQLKRSLLSTLESGGNIVENLGMQALFSCTVDDAATLCNAIDSISPDKVRQASKKVSSSKFSMASVGNLKSVPYVDEL